MTDAMKKYGIKYVVEAGSFTKADPDVAAGKAGLTDAFLLVSVVGSGATAHEGSKSYALVSKDGRGARDGKIKLADAPDLEDTELFQIMTVIANLLAEKNNPKQPEWQREMCRGIIGATRDILDLIRDEEPKL